MYHYVEDKQFLKKARGYCSGMMIELRDELQERGINSQPILIGSGAKNMITQNGNLPIDYDYNIKLLGFPKELSEKNIKDKIKVAFDVVLKKYKWQDCDDSTSSLTTKDMYLHDDSAIHFSIDVGIIKLNSKGSLLRLIHKKKNGVNIYEWHEIPDSEKIKRKSKAIKVSNYWTEVRGRYIGKKDLYLSRNELEEHPSFICYNEVVNEVFYNRKLSVV